MDKMSDRLDFRDAVIEKTDCYVGEPDGLPFAVNVLVSNGSSASEPFCVSESNNMVCTRVNTLRDASFEMELTFEHISRTELGDSE